MSSFQARVLDSALRVLQVRNVGNRIFPWVYRYIATNAKPTRRLKRHHHCTMRLVKGQPVYDIRPKESAGSPYVLYLHGGAYFSGFCKPQWDFVDRLIGATGCRVTAPDYPRAPDAGPREIFAMILPLYREIIAETDPSPVIIFGDSSGGGLALVLVQMLRDDGLPQPRRIILSAPWLDVTMSNPEIARMESDDPFLGLKECRYAGRLYAGRDDPTDPMISPINGLLDGLCPISLFVGTRDLMLPDCRKLKGRFDAAGTPIEYREYPGMLHDWIMLRLPESHQALREVAAIIRAV